MASASLREIAPDLWVTERPLRFFGAEVGTRMTVVRLQPGGALWLHSPVALDPGLRKELDALGPVRFVVAPNRFHHLYAGDYVSAGPEVELFAAPGLPEKRRDLAFHAVLGDEAPAGWAGQIDQLFFRGAPLANEVVFCHRASSTLLLTDLAFNYGPETPPTTRFLLRLIDAYDQFGPSRVEKWLVVRDRAAARSCLEQVLAWDFDRAIVAHGRVLETGAREALRAGYAWLLEE